MQAAGDNEKGLKVVEYERTNNSAVSITDRLTIRASEKDMDALKDALKVVERFENLVLSEFRSNRGYFANDRRYSDVFREIHFWFKDGFVMASIRHGSVG